LALVRCDATSSIHNPERCPDFREEQAMEAHILLHDIDNYKQQANQEESSHNLARLDE